MDVSSLLQDYLSCNVPEKKSDVWDDLVKAVLNNALVEPDEAEISIDFVNALAREFLSSIDKQCMLCEDDPSHLLNYLCNGTGCYMLVVLNLYAEQVSSCCAEVCDVLLSIIPLLLQDKLTDSDTTLDIFQIKTDLTSFKHQLKSLSKHLIGMPTNHISESSSDNCSDKPDEAVEKHVPTKQTESLTLKRKELFYHILSAFLGIAQNNVLINNIPVNATFIEKLLQSISREVCRKENITPSDYQTYGILQVAAVLMFELSISKEGVSMINSKCFFKNIFESCLQLVQSSSSCVHIFLCLSTIRLVCSCIYRATSPSLSFSLTETTKLLNNFQNLQDLGAMKTAVLQLDKKLNSLDIDMLKKPIDIYLQNSIQTFDFILKILCKICKQVQEFKGQCNESTSKLSENFKSKNSKRTDRKRSVKISSSEDESSASEIRRNQNRQSDEESAGDLSDFDFFVGSSGAELDDKNHPIKSKEMPVMKKGHLGCFTCHTTKLFVQIFNSINHTELQGYILRALHHVNICSSYDIDQYIVGIISKLPDSSEGMADKSLSLVSHIIISHPDYFSSFVKPPTMKRSSSSSRNKISPKMSNLATLDETVTDEVDGKQTKTYQFIAKLKTYLSVKNTELKICLLKHFKIMAYSNKIPQLIQREIFNSIILKNFVSLFPTSDLKNVKACFSFSESPLVLKGYLEVILAFMKVNEQLSILFCNMDGIEISRVLSMHEDVDVSRAALQVLEFLAWLSSNSPLCLHKEARKGKSKSPTVQLEEISLDAIQALVYIADKQFNSGNTIDELLTTRPLSLLLVLSILESFYQEVPIVKDEFSKYQLDYKCGRLFDDLIQRISKTIENEEKDEIVLSEQTFVMLHEWMEVMLPLQLCLSVTEEDRASLIEKLLKSSLNPFILSSSHGTEIILTVLQSATKRKRKLKSFQLNSGEDMTTAEIKSPMSPVSPLTESSKDHRKFLLSQEEKGYEADQESEDSDSNVFSRHLSLHQDQPKKSSTSSALRESNNQVPVLTHSWICVTLLEHLAEKKDELASIETLLEVVLTELYDYQLLSLKNNICLSKEGLLPILIGKFGFMFEKKYSTKLQELIGKTVIHLSSHKISAYDLKLFLELFKKEGMCMDTLSNVLLQMAQTAGNQFGPRYHLEFPVMFSSQYIADKQPKSNVQRAQSFMIHKHEQHIRHRSRSQSWSSSHEGSTSVLKPLSYSNQQPSLDSAVVKLPLESKFVWPDKEFSISLWYNLEDTAFHRYECEEKNFAKNNRKQRSMSLLYQRFNEAWCEYGCEELYHLCSFGGTHALFEIWIGSRTGSLQYRWITSNDIDSTSEQMTVFDQIIIQNQSTVNKWHHLVVSLMLPSQPSTAEIYTFLDGSQLPKTSMKYPQGSLHSQTKLFLLLGYGYKDIVRKAQHERTLKTGICMVFQGKRSFMDLAKQTARNPTHKPLIDQTKAIYLYSLGPNSSNINTDYQEFFSNQVQSHMDSSLNWDSIVFKEMSFGMSILSQELVSNNFPLDLLEKPFDVIPNLKIELQSSLMLIYNPQCHQEFLQFIPRFKSSGQIQHIYITDTAADTNQPFDGNINNTTLYGDIVPCHTETFQDAVHNSGGMAVLLFLHAMAAEKISSEISQSAILRAIFITQDHCPFLLREMNDLAGYVLINRSLKLSPTQIDIRMIKALLYCICHGDIFLACDDETDHHDIVNKNTNAIVKNVCILQMILKDWYILRNTAFNVQELFWCVLEALVRPDHPNARFNIMQFQRARVVENLLMACQDLQQEGSKQLPLSLCKLYIGVISNLLGQPIDLPVLKAICSFLIAIHPTLDTLTLHSARNFYLIAKVSNNTLNVPMREHPPLRMSKSERSRRTASFNELDLIYRDSVDSRASSPQVILSQEDLSIGSIIQSEVIIHRPSICSINASEATTCECESPVASTPFKLSSNPATPELNRKESSNTNSPVIRTKQRGHRRIQSDGAIKFAAQLETFGKLKPKPVLMSAESQDYEIISDSELPSSYEGHEEYLVVDGFIDQTVSSCTPQQVKEEAVVTKPDMLFHLRLGLMKLLKTTLTLLPDNMVTRVFGTILKVENLLALVNQPSDKLREIALENLMLYLQRGGKDCLANFNRFMGCHLLANQEKGTSQDVDVKNQLHQHSITVKIIELCISLLVSQPLSLTKYMLSTLECKDDDITPMAIVPCLTLLESCIQKPTSFGMLIHFFITVFEQIESLPLIAFDHGLADVIGNIVYGLANDSTGGTKKKELHKTLTSNISTSWKKESFGYLLKLIDWLIEKACCTCQSLYFQMYKDLHLTLENIDVREKEKKGMSPALLYKTCHFLRYYLVQSALTIFKTSELYITQARYSLKSEESYLSPTTSSIDFFGTSSSPGSSRRASAARNFMKKIRGGVQVVTPPTVATPGEIQERFLEVLYEAVQLATIFNKGDHMTDYSIFGQSLRCLIRQPSHAVNDGDREFCKDLLEWLFDSVQIALMPDQDTSSWGTLMKLTKDDVILMANRMSLHFVSPNRSLEVRLHFIQQVLRYKDNKTLQQHMLFNNAVAKEKGTSQDVDFKNQNKERFFACLHSILSINQSQLSTDEKEMFAVFKKIIPKTNFSKVNDQKLLEDMRELKHKKKAEEIFKRKEAYKRINERNTDLCQTIANQGMEVSKVIVEEQDRQRQRLLRVVRGNNSKDVEVRKTWRNLIHHLTQERAPWYTSDSYPQSWQLDPTEGPSRMRKRLQRCHLEILPKFFLDPTKQTMHPKSHLSYLFQESIDGERPTYYSFKTNDTIRFLYHCKRVTPATKNTGEVLIGETHMYFVGDDILEDNNLTQAFFGERDVVSISWRYDEIQEILKRRYSLQNNALEIFLTSGRTFLLAFENTKDRDAVYEQLVSRELPNLITNTTDLLTLTTKWKEGHVTNFEYLMELNKKAGRSFNDLMQYPVFPFILSQYDEDILDLNNSHSFRNLRKPIACQDKGKEERYIEYYNYLKADYEQLKVIDAENATPPYHYSSHYSNSGTVLHFLVRLPPFTSMFLKYQDNQFDIPDRTFHSMSTTWKLSSFISNTDVKELIPEFFFLQEFLLNSEQFNMGVRQTKERVDDVILPKWCNNDPRLFTLIHLQALESQHISSYLHHWIDLVFGFKQSGQAAIKATNVFHPATYFGVDVNAIKDKIHRRALQTMIETYGQTPLQLFSSPHPKRFTKQTSTLMDMLPSAMESMKNIPIVKEEQTLEDDMGLKCLSSPIESLQGVRWGNYCGSPCHPPPVVSWVHTCCFTVKNILTSTDNLSVYLCPSNICIVSNTNSGTVARNIGMLTWGHNDMLIRVHSSITNVKTTFNPMRPDEVTCCEYVPGSEILLVGGISGVLNVWPVKFSLDGPSLRIVGAKQNLLGHNDVITSIQVCQAYSIAVTTSKDCTAILWDLNRLCYIRSIPEHESCIEHVTVNKASGDIATACNYDDKGLIYLWSVNAKRIGKITDVNVNCLAFSSLPDGVAVNVIAAGLNNGMIRMWDTWTLQPLRSLQANSSHQPVTALSFSLWDPFHLFSADKSGNVYLWTNKDVNVPKPPTFLQVTPNQ